MSKLPWLFDLQLRAMDCKPIFNDSRQQNKVDDNTANCFDLLPREVVIEILSRLPITSLVQLTLTCRSLNLLSHDPDLLNMHHSRSSNRTPSLILHSDYPLKSQLHFLQLCDRKIRKLSPPVARSMPEYKIVGSCNGILCLVDALLPETMYLYNPFTRDYKELPKNFSFRDQIIVYGFGMDPLTNDYKVIKIGWGSSRRFRQFNPDNTRAPEAQIYSLRTDTWRNKGSFPYKLEENQSSPGLFLNGKLHWTSQFRRFTERCLDRVIVSYNLSDDSLNEIKKPTSATRWVNCHLSALDGCLCATVTGPRGYGAAHIWVMKEYGVEESWVKVYAIRSYYPVSMISDKLERSHHIWRNMFSCSKSIRLLCVMESGKVLLEYKGAGLVSYDHRNETFEDLRFAGMPGIYQVTVLVGSLKPPVA